MKPLGVVGNLSRDLFDGSASRVGGGPYHCGRALRALGRRGVIVTKSAEGDRRDLLTPLVCLGLPVFWHAADSTAAFSIAYNGEMRTMVVEHLGATWTPDEARGWVRKALAGVEWLHVAPLARSDFSAETLAELARGRRLSFDGQGLVRPGRTGPLAEDADYDPALLDHLAVLKLAEDEAQVLLGEVEDESLARLGVPEILVTLGSRGCLVFAGGRATLVPARTSPAGIDPTGAGDAFTVAYLAARTTGHAPVPAALRASSLVADLLSGRLR